MSHEKPKQPSCRLYTDPDLDELRRQERIAQLRKSIQRKHVEYLDKVNKQLKLFTSHPNTE